MVDLPTRVLLGGGIGSLDVDINNGVYQMNEGARFKQQLFGSYLLSDDTSNTGMKVYKKEVTDPDIYDQFLYNYENSLKQRFWVVSNTVNKPGSHYLQSKYDFPNPASPLLRWGTSVINGVNLEDFRISITVEDQSEYPIILLIRLFKKDKIF